jgi:hypothetical protein
MAGGGSGGGRSHRRHPHSPPSQSKPVPVLADADHPPAMPGRGVVRSACGLFRAGVAAGEAAGFGWWWQLLIAGAAGLP